MNNIKEARLLKESIYAIEPLCYYFNMKPHEFWECTYREVSVYSQSCLAKVLDDFKRCIQLEEASTDKLISGDSMRKNPKLIKIRDTFKYLFNEKKASKKQSISEQIKTLRSMK